MKNSQRVQQISFKNVNFFLKKRFFSKKKECQKKPKKDNFLLKTGLLLSVLFQRLQNSRSVFELKRYYYLKKRYGRNLINYYRGLFDYYSDRVYEDGSEHKFNERVWVSDLKNIKHAINAYIYKTITEFFSNPLRFIKESALLFIIKDNVKFWKRIIPQMLREFYIIFVEVIYSFYVNHDKDKFDKKFSRGAVPAKKKEVSVNKGIPNLIVDLEKNVEEEEVITKKIPDEKLEKGR